MSGARGGPIGAIDGEADATDVAVTAVVVRMAVVDVVRSVNVAMGGSCAGGFCVRGLPAGTLSSPQTTFLGRFRFLAAAALN